jgi:CubicO group peptidase (beta-lactamase class C family)
MLRGKVKTIASDQLLSITGSPGAQWIVADAEKIISECYAGISNLSTQQPVSPATTFNAFSVTKTATAAAILKLADLKKINLNDPVNPMFNEFHFKYPFTIQQLISHQAGFPDPIPISWIHLATEDPSFDENRFITSSIDRHSNQKFRPGTRFSYSSVGYLILGRIIEKAIGESYANYIRKNIIPELKEGSSLDFQIKRNNDHATGYHPRFSFSNLLLEFLLDKKKFVSGYSGRWMSFNNFYVNGKAYGGFVGNARGLIAYMQSYLEHGIFYHEETERLMFTEQKGGMSLGWFTGSLLDTQYVCHAGGGGGYYCEIRIYPNLGLASVLLRNKSSFGDLRLLDKIDAQTIF